MPDFKPENQKQNHQKPQVPTIALSKATEVPSKFISYPQGASISYRPYTFGEVKIISQSKMTTEQQFKEVLSGIETNFPQEDLTLSDFLYIGLLRKISTLGSVKFTISFKCAKCKSEGKKVISSTDLDFNELDIPEIPVVADLSLGEYHFNPITVGNYLQLAKENKEHDTIAATAIQCCNHEFKDVYEMINNLTSNKDGMIINEVDKIFDHGVKPIEIKCTATKDDKECGHINNLIIDDGRSDQFMILPFREHKESPRNHIRFGTKRDS